MRVVIFSDVDFEAMTVVEINPDRLNGLRSGDYLRFLPRMKMPSWQEMTKCSMDELPSLHIIDARMEEMHYQNHNGRMKTWVGFARDDGLTLRSTFLPGQMAELVWEMV